MFGIPEWLSEAMESAEVSGRSLAFCAQGLRLRHRRRCREEMRAETETSLRGLDLAPEVQWARAQSDRDEIADLLIDRVAWLYERGLPNLRRWREYLESGRVLLRRAGTDVGTLSRTLADLDHHAKRLSPKRVNDPLLRSVARLDPAAWWGVRE